MLGCMVELSSTGTNDMAHDPSVLMRRVKIAAASVAIWLLAVPGIPATAQSHETPPITTPFPEADFHFSDPARDRQYWLLEGETERTMAAFRESVDAARRAIFSDTARPSTPAPLGTVGWLEARAAVERSIVSRRAASRALSALVAFVTRARQQVSGQEAEYALDVRHANERTMRATSDTLVGLLAALAGIEIHQWPP